MSEQETMQTQQQLQVPPTQNFDTASFQGSMQEVLQENIGNYVLVDFLIGTGNLISRQGFLYYVGTQFIVLYDSLNLRYVVCDIFSIKFVTFLLPGYQPGQILTDPAFAMNPSTPNTHVVSEMTPASEANNTAPNAVPSTQSNSATSSDSFAATSAASAAAAMTPAQAAFAQAMHRTSGVRSSL